MKAAVAAGSLGAASAAQRVLGEGGNAFDAVIAAGFAAAVAEPCLTSLGGGGFLLALAGDEPVLYDFFVDVPGIGRSPTDSMTPPMIDVDVRFRHATQVFHVGAGSVAVPGVLHGYLTVHELLGRVPLGVVLAPAIGLAERGFRVGHSFSNLVALLDPTLSMTQEGRTLFRRNGRPLHTGDHFTNPALAEVLHEVRTDRRRCLMADELGGAVTSADVQHHRVVQRSPLQVTFRGLEVTTNPRPSLGGHLISHGLSVLQHHPNLDVVQVATALVSMDEERRRLAAAARRGTTHISVADADGNIASMTTSNGSGSGVFAPNTGVQLNNMMGEDDLVPGGPESLPPGQRVGSMMAPTLVRQPDGHVVALGSGGSERIRSTILQLIVALAGNLDRPAVDRPTLETLVTAPRIHWDGTILQAEPGLPPVVLASLREQFTVNEWATPDLYFGGAHCASTTGEAAGDPRREGVGLVVDP